MTRQSLHLLGRTLIGLLLFGQLAIAAYACPVLTMAVAPAWSAPAAAEGQPGQDASGAEWAGAGDAMSDCEQMRWTMVDPASAKLCAEHCNYGQQSDQPSPLPVPGVLLNTLYVTPAASDPAAAQRPAAVAPDAAAAAPPHAILHCCLRL